MPRILLVLSLLFIPVVASAVPLDIAGFGDSITCTTCNDGSYLSLLGPYFAEAPTTQDYGVSATTSTQILSRLDTWLAGGGTADWVIILAGTVDVFQSVGGFRDVAYNESVVTANINSMIDLVLGASMSVLVVAPPPTQSPCGFPSGLTCADIDNRLFGLSSVIAGLASSRGVPLVDLYDAFLIDPAFSEAAGSALSLYRTDGLHPRDNGDLLIASAIAGAINAVPEPSTGLLVSSGLLWLVAVKRRKRRG